MPTPSGHTSAIRVTKVIGSDIHDATGMKIGEVEDVMLDKLSSNIMFAVVSFGGFLGMAQKYHAIHWTSLKYDTSKDGYVGNFTKEQLAAAPAGSIEELARNHEVDLIELNEAFAAQVLADGYALADQGWEWDKVNVNGGAIALGHPLGASRSRVLTTLLYALQDRGLKRGIASLCLGGGEAVAMAVEIED